jgi:hypothetical protein
MAEEGKAKYAAEIWEIVRLFARLSRTVYGLFLLIVAWAFLVKAGRETLASKDIVEGIWLPLANGWPPTLRWYHPSVSSILIAGAIVLVFWWVFYSRLLGYVWAFSRHLIKPVAFLLGAIIMLIAGITNLILLPLILPLISIVRTSRRNSFRKRWLAQREKKLPAETQAERVHAWESHMAEMKKKHGDEMIEQTMTSGDVAITPLIILSATVGLVGRVLRGSLSRGRIGLARVEALSYFQEFSLAKLPLQVFAQAITRIRYDLAEISLLDRIHFVELPPSARMQQWNQALRFAWLFDLDVLLWGTYQEKSDRTILLNLLSRRPRTKRPLDNPDKFASEYQNRFFPWNITVDFPSLSFDQDDPYDVYLALLVAEILSLETAQRRWERGWKRIFRNFRVMDQISMYGREAVQDILVRVVPRAIGELGPGPLPVSTPITSKMAIVEIAGQWIGSMFNWFNKSTFEELKGRRGETSTIGLLAEIARACVRLKPDDPILFYRLGALMVLKNAADEAVHAFTKAGEIEKRTFQVHEIGARVAASMINIDSSWGDETGLSAWAAHAACAINTGSESSIREIGKLVEEEIPNKTLYKELGWPEPTAITVIKKMLPMDSIEKEEIVS